MCKFYDRLFVCYFALFRVVLLYMCRPDLIDWARVCLQTPRENLQLAFDVAERVYNVTRLLDPEGDDDDGGYDAI